MMSTDKPPRREFLQGMAGVTGAILIGANTTTASEKKMKFHLASNQYSWLTFYKRDNRDFNASLDEGLKDLAKSGLDGYEPSIGSPEQIDTLEPLLKKHGLEMRSLYVNSTLHEESQAQKSIEDIVNIARRAKKAGTRIIVTNPNPIRWGSGQDKSDEQLRTQARALNELGKKLSAIGLTLAYHNHDAEMRNSAREFHHMMVGTDPEHVSLCLDAQWVYRGSGNSNVALLDIVKLYGDRVSELHLRQERNGAWSETFGEGEIDYESVIKILDKETAEPHLVLEQAVEKGTPHTMDPVEVHRHSAEYARRLCAPLAG